jgi:hypothetical protein
MVNGAIQQIALFSANQHSAAALFPDSRFKMG